MSKKETGIFRVGGQEGDLREKTCLEKEPSTAGSCRSRRAASLAGASGCWEGPCAHLFSFRPVDLCDLPPSLWLRPVKGPAEELRQAAAGCPPVSEEPDQPGEEVLLRPVSVARHQVRALGAAELQASGSGLAGLVAARPPF